MKGGEGTSESDGNTGKDGNGTKDILTSDPTSDSEGGSIQEVDVPKKNRLHNIRI